MDRNLLKKTLHDQAEPISAAVSKKLAYLSGDDVFLPEDSAVDFTSLLAGQVNTVSAAETVNKRIPEPTIVEDKIALHKQNLAEKIAALRGVSVVQSGYYNQKK